MKSIGEKLCKVVHTRRIGKMKKKIKTSYAFDVDRNK